MNLLRRLYFGPFTRVFSILLHCLSKFSRRMMVYGWRPFSLSGFKPHSRISSTSILLNARTIEIADHVWIGHGCLIDGSSGVRLDEGVQLAFNVSVFTHGSQHAIRFLGDQYIYTNQRDRPFYDCASVAIGCYTYVGSSSILMPGVKVGRGCVIAAGSIVTSDVPDYSLVRGAPARRIGDTRDIDRDLAQNNRINIATYYQRDAPWMERE